MRTLLRVAPVLLLTLAACDSTPPAPLPASIVLDRTELMIDDGDTAHISYTVLDQRGQPMDSLPASTPLRWSTSAALVAMVEDGLVRAVGPGDAEIVASAGEAEATASVTVRAVAAGFRPASAIWHQGTVATPLEDSIGIRVLDRSGRPLDGVPVHFEVTRGGGTLSQVTVPSGPRGAALVRWVLGPVSGTQAVDVTVEGLRGRLEFLALAAPGPPAEVRPYSGNGQAGSAGEPLPLPVKARVGDVHGNPVGGVTVQWAVSAGGGTISASSAVTDSAGVAATGWELGQDGEQALVATVSGLAPALFTATTDGSGNAPRLTSIAPAHLQPGELAQITGENFGSDLSVVRVTIADVETEVLGVSPGALEIRLPDRTLLPCGPVTDATVVVTVDGVSGSVQHPLEVAMARALAPGEAVSLRTAADISCNQLPAEGDYIITAASAVSTIGTMVPIHVRGMGGSPLVSRLPSSFPLPTGGGAVLSAFDQVGDDVHARVLHSSREVLEARTPSRRARTAPLLSLSAAAIPEAGDTLDFRVPDIRASSLCSSYFTVRARVVHVGTRAIALEDIAAPLAGTMDARIQQVAAEYDSDMHPLLVENFGDPLAIDALTNGDGRLYMLFTKHVNDSGTRGFVWGGDFTERDDCAASNQAEVFYAAVPLVTDGGYSAATPEHWSWTMRNVVVHEVKHLASYAERLSAYFAGGPLALEDMWLEESTARVSEEIWVRTVYGYQQRGNTTYAESVYCELRPTSGECADMPFVMVNHFAALYRWYRAGGSLTPLGRTASDDNTFYGSGWSLARWSADHSSVSEATFFRRLTAGHDGSGVVLSGVENLAARTGREFADLVEDWGVAMAVDDSPDMQAADPRHTFPSWNTRDLFAGLNSDLPDTWSHAAPALVRNVPLDGTTQSFYNLKGGSAAYWGVTGGPAVVEIKGSSSIGLEPYVRIVIIRTR